MRVFNDRHPVFVIFKNIYIFAIQLETIFGCKPAFRESSSLLFSLLDGKVLLEDFRELNCRLMVFMFSEILLLSLKEKTLCLAKEQLLESNL